MILVFMLGAISAENPRMEVGSVAKVGALRCVFSLSFRPSDAAVSRLRTTFLDWYPPARPVGLTSWMARPWCALVHPVFVTLPFFPRSSG